MSKSKPIKQESEESNGSDIDIFQSVFVSKNTSGMVKIGSENDNRLLCGQTEEKRLQIEGDEKKDPMKEELSPDSSVPSPRPPILKEENPPKFVPEPIASRRNEDVFIEVIIDEPRKVGDGISSFMAYGVRTKTNSGLFTKSELSVSRRFSDFLGLHEKLKEKYTPLGRIVPPAPDKNIVSTTKAKIIGNGVVGDSSTNTVTNSNNHANAPSATANGGHAYAAASAQGIHSIQSSHFIQRRRLALERFVNRIAIHPILNRDPDFIDFLENPRELPRATSTSAISSASVFRLLGRVGDTMNKMTYKIIEETDPWFLENIQHIDNLETQLKKLYNSVEALLTCRQELANATSQFAISISLLAQAEEAHSLSRALSQLAKVEEKVESVHNEQSDADLFYLFELLKDYVGLVGAIKEAFHERDKAFQAWQHAQSMVIKKKEQRARAEMSGRFDKIPSASEEVSEWDSRSEEAHAHFDSVSAVIKTEIEFFDQYRVKDFKVSILRYVEALHRAQCDLVKHWEDFLPEVKSILF